MRGKPSIASALRARGRITPAYAGKTLAERVRIRSCWDHPRVCGENAEKPVTVSMYSGSPPRMRGKPYRQYAEGATLRITPAYAGKTPAGRSGCRRAGDHPRVCGENSLKRHSRDILPGSPPRMRGKPAGNSRRKRVFKDHPRVCGENSPYSLDRTATYGSPPRMRGKPSNGGAHEPLRRITPAYAGKTFCKHT